MTPFDLLFSDRSVERLENDGHEIMTFGALDLLEGLDVLVLGAVEDGKNFCDEVGFVTRPVAACACIQ